jgi:glucose/arabinose dehydrogenase
MSRRLTTAVVVVLALLVAAALVLSSFPPPAGGQARSRPFVTGLAFPTNLAFAPDGRLFVTEKETGRIRIVRDGTVLADPFVTLTVVGQAERGLLGIAIGPTFEQDPWVYVYLSDASDGRNRLIRIRAEGDEGGERETILDLLPAVSGYHNGGDLAFGPDGSLFVVTGEAHEPALAQDPDGLGGKVLRIRPDGSIPQDNPFGADSPVYSLGHRNSFGVCVDPNTGQVWQTENGPDRLDEVNRIEPGGNYGWPEQLGPGGGAGFEDPILAFTDIIVPTGCAVLPDAGGGEGTLVFGDFGGRLRQVRVRGEDAGQRVVATFPTGITDVAVGPDGALYVATTDAIHRVEGIAQEPEASPTPSPEPTAEPTSPAPAASPAGRDERGPDRLLALAIALVAGAGIAALLLRRRRETGPPARPPAGRPPPAV